VLLSGWDRGLDPPGLLVALLPGALTVFLAFDAGGFYAGETALAALVAALALLGRIALARHPFEGVGRTALLAIDALVLLCVLTVVSMVWSDAPIRALTEGQRVLLYLLVFALCASPARDAGRLRLMTGGVLAAAATVCGAALLSRLLPGVLDVRYTSPTQGLSWPVTYTNTLGLLAAVGLVLALGAAARRDHPGRVEVAAAAVVPLFALTALLTLSRGALVAGAAGVLAMTVLVRSRAVVLSLLATAPPVVLVAAAALADDDVFPAPGRDVPGQAGEELALTLVVCMLLAGGLRAVWGALARRWDAGRDPPHRSPLPRVTAIGAAVACVLGAVALEVPQQLDRRLDRSGDRVSEAGSADGARRPLSELGNDGRLDFWEVAVEAFEDKPLTGTGAGTFALRWDRHRPEPVDANDAHSLYAEVLAELGLGGLALVLLLLATILGGLLHRARRGDRVLYGTVAGAVVTWLLAAGIDWHWEMPVVTLWLFALAGASLSRTPDESRAPPGVLPRMVGCVLLVVAVAAGPARLATSQRHTDQAYAALVRGDCPDAERSALEATRALPPAAVPHEILAYCAARRDDPAAAARRFAQAARRDPSNWRYRLGLAAALARRGRDPRPAAAHALGLNPLEPRARSLALRLASAPASAGAWRREGRREAVALPLP